MEKHSFLSYDQISDRIKRVCHMYSKIGEPLDVDTIIDLYHHLGGALQLMRNEKVPQPVRRKQLS